LKMDNPLRLPEANVPFVGQLMATMTRIVSLTSESYEKFWTRHIWESVKGQPFWYQTLYFLFCINDGFCEKCNRQWDWLLFAEETFQE